MDTQKNPKDSQKQKLPNWFNSWFWWLILLLLLVWNFASYWPSTKASVSVPYSTFIAQVQAGNVAQVKITGNDISGTFVKPILWPTASAKSAATQQPGNNTTTAPKATTKTKKSAPTEYGKFETIFPSVVGDPALMPLLKAKQVRIVAANPPSPWIATFLIDGLPFLLLIGFFIWMARKGAMGQAGGALGFGKSKARKYTTEDVRVTFDDVAGAEEVKTELEQVVDFLRSPQKYHRLGARIPHGVLLVGPPGTGKTLMARAVAGEAGVPFLNISASEFVEMFVGVGASRVRDLFAQAKSASPAIVFIDELDAVGRRRGAGLGAVNDEREQTLNQLLVEMDGFDERHEIIVLAATNRPDVLDPALLRPGRFDREITMGLPDLKGREGIFHIHVRDLDLAPDVDIHTLAMASPGFSGADIANLCNEAALMAAEKSHQQITMSDFEEAQDKIILGGVRPLLLDEHDRKIVAYHEGGHTVVAWFSPQADPVHKVTIIPRGRALGVTEQLPGGDQYNVNKRYLLDRLAVMLGGRTSEEIVFESITTGAENDLVEATKLARRMVTRWGMSELGLIAFAANESQPFLGYEMAQGRDYSEATAARIDAEVRRLLEDRHQAAHRLITEHRAKLDKLARALLAHETVGREKLEEILGPRPPAPA